MNDGQSLRNERAERVMKDSSPDTGVLVAQCRSSIWGHIVTKRRGQYCTGCELVARSIAGCAVRTACCLHHDTPKGCLARGRLLQTGVMIGAIALRL
jgi:hypothetical protein